MNFNIKTDSLIKTVVLSLGAALLLGACDEKPTSHAGGNLTGSSVEGRTAYETATDHAIGSADAPVTIIEYASVTCPHCATWSLSVLPELQEKYINTGKVRYVFRPFPTPPVDLANAGHLLAACAPEEKYFDLLHVQFKRQMQIRQAVDIKGEFIKLAKSAGMNEKDFDACMVNQAELDILQSAIVAGSNSGVTSTPTFFFNGKRSPSGTFDMESFEKIIAEILGEPVPESSETPDAEDSGH